MCSSDLFPSHDKTARFDIALDAADSIAKSYMARRENKGKTEERTEGGTEGAEGGN